jgi:cyanophycinase
MKAFPLLAALLLLRLSSPAGTVGPEHGALLIHGGGRLGPETVREFIRLAGGIDVPFVIIPTADPGEDWGAEYVAKSFLTRSGAKDVIVLHTRDRAVADSEAFVAPLRRARGVWFGGGRQWRLADSYLRTLTEKELHAVLARGGVIGGSSAGATIQGSYLVRGAPEGNEIMMAKGHEEGFGFLKQSAIDQHVNTRRRENDLVPVIDAHPELLGMALDEGTAVVVQGDRLRVLGQGRALFLDRTFTPSADGKRTLDLAGGEGFDLQTRRKIAP